MNSLGTRLSVYELYDTIGSQGIDNITHNKQNNLKILQTIIIQ